MMCWRFICACLKCQPREAMSQPTLPPMAEEETLKLVLTNEGCKRDEDLKVSPPQQSEWTFTQSERRRSISPFPFLVTFIKLACMAYEKHGKDETYLCGLLRKLGLRDPPSNETDAPAELAGVPEGFELLATAEGTTSGNGYFGIAYINRKTSQIILSHRGTEITNWGALKTDVKSIWWGKFTPQVSSAITFAHIVAQYSQENSCQLFFTGHSLGAWLAQITCFSAKYLTSNGNGYFVRKSSDLWDDLHPYTVAFDSPGALEFLSIMKKHLFPRNEPQSQMINVACLPIEVFQFYPNSVNTVNTQVGSVYIVDLDKAGVEYSYVRWYGMKKSITKKTHSSEPVNQMMTEKAGMSETEVVRCQVLHWRVGEKWDDFLHKWGQEGRAVPVELHKFPEYHLKREELKLLEKHSVKEVGGGCYEGLSSDDEEVANRVVEYCKSKEVFLDGSVRLGEKLDRREVIPQVRQFTQALKNEIIWWNPTKPPVPENYIGRSVAETRYFKPNGSLDSCVPRSRLEELVEPLVLVVDPPGMGKSTEMSDLERKLTMKVSGNRVILRVNLNAVQKALSNLSQIESASRVLLKLAPFLPANIFETSAIRVFVLLDGLDEVCPAHQATMINLLRIFRSSEEQSMRDVSVRLTMRPHLRQVLEEEFNLESWSLLPLTVEQQDEYMKSVLKKSSEEISGIRGKLTMSVSDMKKQKNEYMKSVLNKSSGEISGIRSKLTESVSGLLGIPLMLSMFVDVIKSGGDFGGEDLNTFQLYEKFVLAKHVVYMVEKRGVKEEDNYTQMDLMNILERSLPHYYRAAIDQLVHRERDRERIFEECRGIVAQEEPSGVARLELISIGLLVEDSYGRLVFKHLSFAEFFYARLLTVEECFPQGARDVLFGNIYARENVLGNVEAFVAASLLSKTPPPTLLPAPLLLPLSPNWILRTEAYSIRGFMFRNFVNSSRLFPLLVREVLLTCFKGDAGDLSEVLEALLDGGTMDNLRQMSLWMSENREWTRAELLRIDQVGTTPTPTTRNPLGVARLMVAIGLHFEGQELLSEEEVGLAINRCDHRLVSIVANGPNRRSGMSKWEWVEGHLSGGRSKLRELFLQMNAKDLFLMIEDMESAWKLVEILSEKEIFAILENEEARVSFERSILAVGVVLGEEFEMRGGRGFKLDFFWGELVGEMQRVDETGPVTVGLREALRMIGKEDDACELLLKLEGEVRGWSSSCRGGQGEQTNEEEDVVLVGGDLVKWVTKDFQWRQQLNIGSFKALPFVLRYWGTHIKTFLKSNKMQLEKADEAVAVLRSLIIVTSSFPRLFSVLSDFLRANLPSIPQKLQSAAGVFLNATREQIADAACPLYLVSDVSVGGVLLKLLPQLQQQQPIATWVLTTSDVIGKTLCCDLPTVLDQLSRQMEGQAEEGLLKKILTSEDVLREWSGQFKLCRVTQLLPFYFSVFGSNLQWMKTIDGVECEAEHWQLVRNLPVEIATVLPTELRPTFQEILREHLIQKKVVCVGGVARTFSYETDAEWETLLPLINGETLLPNQQRISKIPIPSAVAAPLLRTLIRLYGAEWTKERLTPHIWDSIPFRAKEPIDSVASLGSLLHSAITLGELEEAKKRAWPGLVKWRNAEGKSAVDVAKDKWGEEELHPIRLLLLHKLTCLKLKP